MRPFSQPFPQDLGVALELPQPQRAIGVSRVAHGDAGPANRNIRALERRQDLFVHPETPAHIFAKRDQRVNGLPCSQGTHDCSRCRVALGDQVIVKCPSRRTRSWVCLPTDQKNQADENDKPREWLRSAPAARIRRLPFIPPRPLPAKSVTSVTSVTALRREDLRRRSWTRRRHLVRHGEPRCCRTFSRWTSDSGGQSRGWPCVPVSSPPRKCRV